MWMMPNVLKEAKAQAFTDYLNSVDEDIKWTTEREVTTVVPMEEQVEVGVRTERAFAFLDTWSVIKEDDTIKASVQKRDSYGPIFEFC